MLWVRGGIVPHLGFPLFLVGVGCLKNWRTQHPLPPVSASLPPTDSFQWRSSRSSHMQKDFDLGTAFMFLKQGPPHAPSHTPDSAISTSASEARINLGSPKHFMDHCHQVRESGTPAHVPPHPPGSCGFSRRSQGISPDACFSSRRPCCSSESACTRSLNASHNQAPPS